jgi:hypothetical protein
MVRLEHLSSDGDHLEAAQGASYHCRAHSSESEDLGSVTKFDAKFELPVFQGRDR